MNCLESDDVEKNLMEQNKKKYVPMDLNQISNVISQKINSIKLIDNTLIEEICNGLKLYCQYHNEMINDWFDDNYIDDLNTFKANNKNYLELSNSFSSNSFVLIPNFN